MNSMDDEKEIRWLGFAYDDLLAFPQDPRRKRASSRSAQAQLAPCPIGSPLPSWILRKCQQIVVGKP